jgi:hypothetical protein
VLAQESVEGSDERLVLTQPDERTVSSEHVRMRHRQRHTRLAGISEDELTGFDGSSLAGQRIDAAALNRGLTDRVLVAQRVEVARLGTEVLRRQHGDPGEPLILLLCRLQRVAPGLFAVTEDADPDVDLSGAEGLIPVRRVVRSVVP